MLPGATISAIGNFPQTSGDACREDQSVVRISRVSSARDDTPALR
jgi:hypothetical protein